MSQIKGRLLPLLGKLFKLATCLYLFPYEKLMDHRPFCIFMVNKSIYRFSPTKEQQKKGFPLPGSEILGINPLPHPTSAQQGQFNEHLNTKRAEQCATEKEKLSQNCCS